MKNMIHPKRFINVGPGGINCACCAPAPGSKARKIMFRTAKRRAKRAAFKCEQLNGD